MLANGYFAIRHNLIQHVMYYICYIRLKHWASAYYYWRLFTLINSPLQQCVWQEPWVKQHPGVREGGSVPCVYLALSRAPLDAASSFLPQAPSSHPWLGPVVGGRLQLARGTNALTRSKTAAVWTMLLSPEETVRLGAKQSGLAGGKVWASFPRFLGTEWVWGSVFHEALGKLGRAS